MDSSEIRSKFISFFVDRSHVEIPSQSLVPENDPTTLFIGFGMQPLVPYLLGKAHPEGKRLVNVQRCVRAEDLDEVGNGIHHSFFEMLGCWSLGDYFKKEMIPWTFGFFVDELGFDPKKLYVTVFGGDKLAVRDTESVDIWKDVYLGYGIEAVDSEDVFSVGVGKSRIFYYPREKNWWERPNAPSGDPAGPDTEIFYLTGKKHSKEFGEKCHVNCDCGRYVEVGNDVFMEYKKADGKYVPMANKNIDVGWGFERIVRIVQNKESNFETDLFFPIIKKIEELSQVKYEDSDRSKWIYRVIADHIRASVFLIADGVASSNKAQGYVLRKLLRRIIRFSRELKIDIGFLTVLAEEVLKIYVDPYPHLLDTSEKIYAELNNEEAKFQKVLTKGMKEFKDILAKSKDKVVPGKDAFMLYETYGFPIELTEEAAEEMDYKVDVDGFNKAAKKAAKKSKSLDKGVFVGGLGEESEKALWYHTITHLLHQALIDILGDYVKQRGSNITAERLRFDFEHADKLTDDERKKVEEIVNKKIKESLDIKVDAMSVDEAMRSGALAFFNDKYGDKVSVYSIGDYSKEICGGPHVKNTSEIKGTFKIVKEKSIGAGIRRIRALVV